MLLVCFYDRKLFYVVENSWLVAGGGAASESFSVSSSELEDRSVLSSTFTNTVSGGEGGSS